MLLLPQRKLFFCPNSSSTRIIFMVSKNFLLFKSSASSSTHSRRCSPSTSLTQFSHSSCRKNLITFSSPKHFSPVCQRTSRYSYTPYYAMPIPRPTPAVDFESLEKQLVDEKQLMMLRKKLDEIGFDGSAFMPGQYNGLLCPSCKGGDSEEKSLSLHIAEDGSAAVLTCFRAKCGWKGTARAYADVRSTFETMSTITKIKQPTRVITEESLGLEPLCNELLAYFADRMISGGTLRRNAVMQKIKGDQKIIAFTYWENGHIVGCKYRTIGKRYWQESNTQKYLYGLDDIAAADEIIIVEGEIDKLSLEEAGFYNCVSVPSGAQQTVSVKEIPSPEKDTRFQYLWSCKDYFDKASRIILATDGDVPGQSLAEELARRLGRERCWRVHWPKKDEANSFKDANEVLSYLGADALRDAIDKAELYQLQSLG